MSRIIKFFLSIPVIYLVLVFVFLNIRFQNKSLMDLSTRNPVVAGGFGHSFQRFQEIQHYGDVDILFLGSSHAYRTFDNRLYADYGLKTFNMGSPNQTPLNSYYLLKKHIDDVNPKWVILELYTGVLDRDGLESFYDLATNTPFSQELVEMAFAINSPHAYNKIVEKWVQHVTGIAPPVKQKDFSGEAYVAGGYVEYSQSKPKIMPVDMQHPNYQTEFAPEEMREVELLDLQISYVHKILKLVSQKNARAILVTQPVPQAYLAQISNYEEVEKTINSIASLYDVPYLDFNKYNVLDSYLHFEDSDHLNPEGVRRFNRALIKELVKRNIISPAKSIVKKED